MVDRYPDAFEMAFSAADVERIAAAGKIASLIGIEGGVAIENNLAQLRAFHALGARYMTLTHNTTLDWADAATDTPKHDGLSPFGERVVKEMNRLGMLVDIPMYHRRRWLTPCEFRGPLIASHSSAYALCPSPRNVPDEILKLVTQNGGVIMVNFFSGFIVPESGKKMRAMVEELRTKFPDREELPPGRWKHGFNPRGQTVAGNLPRCRRSHRPHCQGCRDDDVGIGSDFDGITMWPVGLEMLPRSSPDGRALAPGLQ